MHFFHTNFLVSQIIRAGKPYQLQVTEPSVQTTLRTTFLWSAVEPPPVVVIRAVPNVGRRKCISLI